MVNVEHVKPQTWHPSLSTEVEENVIDHVYFADDITTLLNCALTCRDWLPRSRIHLFSAIRLSTLEDTYSFCAFLDTHPEIRMLIRSIIMAPNISEKRPACLLETFPIQLVSRLPRLRGWALRNDLAGDRKQSISHHPTVLKHLRAFAPIVDLDLESLNFASPTVFFRFITSLVRLRHLRCNAVGFDQEGELKLYGIGKLNLITLQVGGIPSDVLCTLLDRTASTLESLVVASQQDVDGVPLVLSRMSILRSLTFSIQDKTDWNMIATALSGTPNLSLRSFRLNIGNLDGLPHPESNGVKNLVSTFLSMKLKSFTINICAEEVQPITTTFRLRRMFTPPADQGLYYPQLVFTGATFLDESYLVQCITVSPDLRWVAAVAKVLAGGVLLWNISGSVSVRKWHIACPMATGIRQVVFSPEDQRVLIVNMLGNYVQDSKRQCYIATIKCTFPLVAAWSRQCIVFLTRGGTLSTWDPATYQPIQDYNVFKSCGGHTADWYRGALLFSPDSRWLSAAADLEGRNEFETWILFRVVDCEGRTKLIDPHSLKELSPGSAEEPPVVYFGEAAFNPASTRMAVLDRLVKVHIWDITRETPIHTLSVDMFTALASSGVNYYALVARQVPPDRLPTKLAFSGDGRHLLLLYIRSEVVQKAAQLEVLRVCAETGCLQNPLVMNRMSGSTEPPEMSFNSDTYQFSPCGRYLVASPLDDGIMVWRTSDGSLVRRAA